MQVRKVGSDKVLIYIDGLNEQEVEKVFRQLKFTTKGEGYEKLKVYQSGEDEIITRRTPL